MIDRLFLTLLRPWNKPKASTKKMDLSLVPPDKNKRRHEV
jgi:hypothetical protein